MCKAIIIFIFLLLVTGLPIQVQAKEPSSSEAADLIRDYMDQILESLQAETRPEPEKIVQKLQAMAQEIFDFELMSRMSLGRHWHDFDQAQKKEFVGLFTTLLEKNYLSRVNEYMQEIQEYSRQDVQVTGHVLLSKRRAEVKSIIKYQNKDIPVNYRLATDGTAWKVYDVHVEGVSLIQNYRSQFNQLLQQGTANELLDKIRDRLQTGDEDLDDLDLTALGYQVLACFSWQDRP